jgi:DNA-binding response OmpR family regulator
MEKSFKILVIDDEEDLRENLKYILQAQGYIVQMAEDGVQGLKKLEHFTPDLIILDMNMPNMGGVEFYQKICEGDDPKYPVFVLTARANMEQLFKELKVEGFMTKPFDIEEFVKEVAIIVKKRSGIVNSAEQYKKAMPLKTVYLVEDDPVARGDIGKALLEAGYRVACVRSGSAALELMAIDPPMLVLVKLALPDIAGDVVVQRAGKMAKTSGIKMLLYQGSNPIQPDSVKELIKQKSGIKNFMEYGRLQQLIAAVDATI